MHFPGRGEWGCGDGNLEEDCMQLQMQIICTLLCCGTVMYAHVHCLLMNSAFVGSPTWLMSLEMVSASIYSPQNVSAMILH